MPLFHIHGLIAGLSAPLSRGGAVFCTPGFNALKFFVEMEEAKPTWYTAVPTMHQRCSDARGRHKVIARRPLRFVRSSSSLPPASSVSSRRFRCPAIRPTDDRGGASDGVNPLSMACANLIGRRPAGPEIAAWRTQGGRRAEEKPASRHSRRQRHRCLREQSEGQCAGVRQWLVPHRRSGRHRRRRLSHAHRAAEGDHQSRRRENLAARGR